MIKFRAFLHIGGGPQVGEVTRSGSPHLSCKRDQIKMRHFMDRRVTHLSGLSTYLGSPYKKALLDPVYMEWGTPV